VEAIARLFPGAVARIHLGSDATESKVKSADFNQVGYLHIATHGLLGGEIVGLDEPALVLAEEPGQDMLLRASEAQQLKLSGVELTVLSACNTGSGRLTSGEGVMGLSRAFMIAGSSAVLVSLWPVSSKATEEMMVSFYQAHKSGLPVEEALQTAIAKMKAKEPHPMVWAPFVIVRS
jgi:CHAT domain-containing protein